MHKAAYPVEIYEPMNDPKHSAGDDQTRYSRQIRFGPIGSSGQRQLRSASVLVVGTGALGASLAQHMTRAGVGTVRLADRDFVEPSNLQRQMLFDEDDARDAMPKAIAAARRLRRINGSIRIEAHVVDVGKQTIGPLIEGVDLVLDGTDNAAARLVLSDACFQAGIPFIYGGVTASEGMSASLIPGRTACLRCLIGGDEASDEAADTCDTAGVISPAVEFVASLQAAEALKWLSGSRDAMRRTWVSADVWTFCVRESKLPAGRAACRHCGSRQEESMTADKPEADDGGAFTAAVLCGRDSVQVSSSLPFVMEQLRSGLERLGCRLTVNPYLTRAVLPDGGQCLVLFPDGRVIVQGTSDPKEAIELCNRYIGNAAQQAPRDAAVR
ncbi:ThiF family adenylyltransferase [Paenibacillus xylaniclasticus]|uniref:ThiF family adenylyltransferase n=1 Tax=Paenibacillus xylaniclasticus TaxID=588083 RepID=UPI0017703F5F|nr:MULTISPECIES: ThiF family adenylyltransferase [Paenibacillus]GFN30997.1 molybdopterin-synthase adenylyltransferase [Paenibacillus curdlanolyticus]